MTSEERVVELLAKYDLKITTAESCTGGLVAATLINVPGVSSNLKAGYITYSDKAKHRILGVRKKTLKKFTAVSDKVAAEMAKGAAKREKADVAISVTGLAGPDGGTDEKPVGLVYIGIFVCGKVRVKECRFDGDRENIRKSAAQEALRLAQKMILKRCGE